MELWQAMVLGGFYWFSFLVEVIDDAGQKKYVWLPDVELQRQHLETGKDVCEVKVEF